jgi:nitronate monooxygenase
VSAPVAQRPTDVGAPRGNVESRVARVCVGTEQIGARVDPSISAGDPRIRTALTERLGIRHPIMLAPMGDTAGGRLAAAVSAAGGLGMIGGGYGHVEWLASQLAIAAGARIGIGFITFALVDHADALSLALAVEPVAIQLSFGDPRPYAPAIKDAGAALVCQVQTAAEIDWALEAGADLLIAQGREAGGHGRPDRATVALVPSVVDRADGVPVVAAGGIADGRGLAAALALGAAGVSMGTRFLASTAALSTPGEADALISHSAADTVRTPVIDLIRGPAWPSGHDGRAVRNELIDRWHDDLPGLAEHREALCAAYLRSKPDDYTTRVVWAGEGLDLIAEIESAGEIVASTVRGAVAQLRSLSAAVEDQTAPSPGRSLERQRQLWHATGAPDPLLRPELSP